MLDFIGYEIVRIDRGPAPDDEPVKYCKSLKKIKKTICQRHTAKNYHCEITKGKAVNEIA